MPNNSLNSICVVHFVTGGFSGATSVAIDLARAARDTPDLKTRAILVLRTKRSTSFDKVQSLRDEGLEVHTISGLMHWWTRQQLRKLLLSLHPDAVVAHGYPEHIIGRAAAREANVPRIIHVEHNSRERYSHRSLIAALMLADTTQYIVGVSEGVCDYLRALGFPDRKILAIPNGVDVQRFLTAGEMPWQERANRVMMCARFARQKDHATLIRAASILKKSGIECPVLLAGTGKRLHEMKARQLAQSLAVDDTVRFLGNIQDVAEQLGKTKIFVLSTHYEGMPLAIIEAMASGCLVIASDVPGARDVVKSGINGWLVPEGDPHALAGRIAQALANVTESARLASCAKKDASQNYGKDLFALRHHALYRSTTD